MYIAQKFRDCIAKDLSHVMMRKYGFNLPNAEHHKHTVKFNLLGVENYITFRTKDNRFYAHLDMILMNGEGIKREKEIDIEMAVKRSKTERISNDYFPQFFGDFVMKNVVGFHKKWLS